MTKVSKLKKISTQVRRDIIRQVSRAASGHPGGSMGCADFLTALYFEFLRADTKFNMKGEGEDMFFLSNGHISPVWYSILARKGYFPIAELAGFRAMGSMLQGHPTNKTKTPGVRFASGSLGQGMSVGIGAAINKKMDGDDKLVYVLTGDGELQEGQIWEAAMFAAHQKVDNIIVTVDWNGEQIDGSNEEVLSLGDLEGKWKSFGWDIVHMNGNDMDDVLDKINKAIRLTGQKKPVVILMKTAMGAGVDFMMGSNAWHGKAPNAEQTEKALAQLEETIGDFPT